MNEQNSNPCDPLVEAIAEAVIKKIGTSKGKRQFEEGLLTPEELAEKLKVPVSWVYEQSRQGKIPTHRIGRYIRFSFAEVIASQQTND